jgi:hypothetical protein
MAHGHQQFIGATPNCSGVSTITVSFFLSMIYTFSLSSGTSVPSSIDAANKVKFSFNPCISAKAVFKEGLSGIIPAIL